MTEGQIAVGALDAEAFAAAYEQPDADREWLLKARWRGDRAAFMRFFFPERFTDAWSPVHRLILDEPKAAWHERPARDLAAMAAPRESAKSTLMSFGERIHDICYGLERFIVLISTTFPLSQDLVKDLYAVFTDGDSNADLHAFFGPFRVTGTQTDFVVRAGGGPPGTRVLAASFGGTVRGVKHDGVRPTFVGIDDGEHPEKVRNPEQRDKTWSFLTKDILKAGRRGTRFRVAGTIMHADGMLARLMGAPGWRATKFRSVLAWPTNTTLWEECRALWADLTRPHREAEARAFYDAHRAEMDAGAEVLWPEHESLWELMTLLWSDGIASFYSEKQNDPRDPLRAVFDVEKFRRCRFDGEAIHAHGGRRIPLGDCELGTWLDPSLGKQTSDYPALATVARERRTGYRFVIQCSLDRGPPSAQRAAVWSRFAMYARGKWGTDATGMGALYGEDFEREKAERRKRGVVWSLPMQGYVLDDDKLVRIARIEPDTLNGWIQFAGDLPPAVIEQFRDFPTGAYDDGPDAIERADWLLSAGRLPTVGLGAA